MIHSTYHIPDVLAHTEHCALTGFPPHRISPGWKAASRRTALPTAPVGPHGPALSPPGVPRSIALHIVALPAPRLRSSA